LFVARGTLTAQCQKIIAPIDTPAQSRTTFGQSISANGYWHGKREILVLTPAPFAASQTGI